jgi:capsular exopolysaccharide synthesis family protein
MTTAHPTVRMPAPAAPRPAQGAGPAAARTLDPIKLLKKYKLVLVAAGVVGIGVGVGAFIGLKRFMPLYTSTTIFQVLPPKDDIADRGRFGPNKEELERFMATQAQSMVSYSVLNAAAEDPVLRRDAVQWCAPFLDRNGRIIASDVIIELEDELVARPVPGTEYLQLSLTHNARDDVAVVVQAVTRAYLSALKTQTNKTVGETRTELQTLIDRLKREVEADHGTIDRLLFENEIESIDARVNEANESLKFAVESLSTTKELITQLTSQLDDFQQHLSDPSGLVVPDQIRGMVLADPRIQQLQAQVQRGEASDRSLDILGFGAEHPSRKAVRAEIEGLSEQLRAEIDALQQERFDMAVSQTRSQIASSRAVEDQLLNTIAEKQRRMTEVATIAAQVNSLQRQIEEKQRRISENEAALDNVRGVQELTASDRVVVVQMARVPDQVSFPKIEIVVPLGFLLVVGLTGAILVMRELLDQRVRGPSDIAMIPRTPVLGMLPDVAEDPSRPERAETAFRDRPTGGFAESIRQLRVTLMTKIQQAGHRSVLIVPATPQSGATTVSVNLAEAASRADMRVLIIDANFRRPAIHKLFNLAAGPGLADLLAGRGDLESTVCKTDNPALDVLTVGSAEHRIIERISTDAMSELLTRLEARYELVFVDVAPALVAGDAIGLANRVGGTVLVARAMAEKRGMIARLKNELTATRAEFLGVIVNGVRAAAGGYLRANLRTAHDYQNHKKAAAD